MSDKIGQILMIWWFIDMKLSYCEGKTIVFVSYFTVYKSYSHILFQAQ